MPTVYKFDPSQIAEIARIRAVLTLPENATVESAGVPLYAYIFQCVTGMPLDATALTTMLALPINADVKNSAIWLAGAANVNSSVGAFSNVIREFNVRQGELRGADAFGAAELQEASNAVAIKLANSILDAAVGNAPNPTYHLLPTVQEIGNSDLNGVRDTLYPGNQNPGSELYLNQAWPGIVMLGALKGVYWDRLLRYDENQQAVVNSLGDFKAILFCWDAFKTAWAKTCVGSTVISDVLAWLNFPTSMVGAVINEFMTNGADSAARMAFGALMNLQHPTLQMTQTVAAITRLDSARVLDMLDGALQAESQLGTTTDANVVNRAAALFTGFDVNQLSSIEASLMPTRATEIAALARTDPNARAALAGLSAIKVGISAATTPAVSLYDSAGNAGGLTAAWIVDRSQMLQAVIATRPGQNAVGSTNTDFVDLESGQTFVQRLNGIGANAPANKIVFGTEEGESVIGSTNVLGDRLHGMAGNDTLTGLAGNDYLEGGAGSDKYVFASTWGKDTIFDADGLGLIEIDGQTLGTIKSAGALNTWTCKLSNGQVVTLLLSSDSASSVTGNKLVITRSGSAADDITIQNFDVVKAKSNDGYLGIKLPADQQVAIVPGGNAAAAAGNPFTNADFDLANLLGSSTTSVTQGFTIFLSRAAEAGATLVLRLGDLAGQGLRAIIGGTSVSAEGATINLAAGQTQVSFALVADTALGEAVTGAVKVMFSEGSSSAASNVWSLTWSAAPAPTAAVYGDQGSTNRDLLAGTGNSDEMHGLTDDDALLGLAGADSINGDMGADVLMGGTGADTLKGSFGDDVIYGSSNGGFQQGVPLDVQNIIGRGECWVYYGTSATDQDGFRETYLDGLDRDIQQNDAGNDIDGGDGNDVILAGTGDDLAKGGEGRDDIVGMGGSDVLMGEAGDDRLRGDGTNFPNLVDYTPPNQAGADVLHGGAGNDVMLGQGGNDDLWGGVDNDKLWGDDRQPADTPAESHGFDYLDGENGNDSLYGGGRNDKLFGGEGNDEMWGDEALVDNIDAQFHGDDYVDGEAGDDSLWGGGRNDTLFGGIGNDVMYGDDPSSQRTPEAHQGQDYLDGEAGNDSLVGGAKEDTLYGDEGNDVLWGDDGAHAVGEAGSLDPASDAADYLDGEAGNDTLIGEGAADRLFGGIGNDSLVGDDRSASLVAAWHGADTLSGEAGNDTLVGNGGADYLVGGVGNDRLFGDADDLAAQDHGADELDGGDGDDGLKGHGGNDVLIGGIGNDTLEGDAGLDLLQGGDGNDVLKGGADADSLSGNTGDDSLQGDEGDDELAGAEGNDQLEGGAGADILAGDVGDDSLYGGDSDDYAEGGEGNDYLQGDGGADVLSGGAGNDFVRGEADDDSIYGDDGADQLQGNDGNDYIEGGAGSDTLFGDAGDDELDGGADVDQLQGGDGNDTLWGEGSDVLFGQAGDDVLIGDDAGGVILSGGEGNDYLAHGQSMSGGAGHDTISVAPGSAFDGGEGNDRYQFDMGLGSSLTLYSVQDVLGANTIDVTGASASLSLAPSAPFQLGQPMDLTALRLDTGNGRIDIRNWLNGTVGSVVVNGTTMDGGEFFGQNFIYALDQSSSAAAATLQGGKQGEALTATGGNATLAGGAGADTLTGSGGNNTYRYNANDGIDTITDTSAAGQGGTLRFGTGLAAADAKLSNDNGTLVITFGADAANAVRMTGFNANNAAQATGITSFAFADGTVLTHAQLVERGFDITGSAADEQLAGTNLADRLNGGAGADTLSGKSGADTYTFKLGDGADLVADGDLAGGTGDALVFGAGIAPAQIVGLRAGNDVSLRITGTNDMVTLKGYFAAGVDTVEQIRFADGTQWTQTQVLAAIDAGNAIDWVLHGDAGSNTLMGMGGNDQLFGYGSPDVLQGGPGNDTLAGGENDDSLFGGAGSDVYLLEETGSGEFDRIDESAGGDAAGVDTVRFTGLASTEVALRIDGNDLVVLDANGSLRATVANQFLANNAGSQVERFEFADGVTLTAAQVHARALTGSMAREYLAGSPLADTMSGNWGADTLMAGAGNDIVHGDAGFDSVSGEAGDDSLFGDAGDDTVAAGDGDDVLDGGAGWDRLDGGAGNDTYAFGIGSGMDIVTADAGGTDTVQLGAAIAAANVTLYRVSAPAAVDLAYGGDSLVIQLNGGADQLWIANYFASGASTIESIRFADSTVWNAATIASRLVAPTGGGTAGTLAGTSRANTFTIDHWNDVINDTTFTDADIANASVSYRLPGSVNVLNLSGTLNVFAAGSSGEYNDKLTGNTGDNRFAIHVDHNGTHPGYDTLAGGAGNDVYVLTASNVIVRIAHDPLDRGGATITELAGQGTDTLVSGYWSAQLPDHVEHLVLIRPNATPSTGYFEFDASGPADYTHRFTGNALANVIDASMYEDLALSQAWASKRTSAFWASVMDFRLDGGAGADTLVGGRWHDTYVLDNAGDTVIELGVQADGRDVSIDTVETPFGASLATQFPHIENLTLTGSAAVGATGNGQANRLDGSLNTAANVLTGGAGDDTYVLGAGDTAVELAGEGTDTVVIAAVAGGTARLADHANTENIRIASSAGSLDAEGNDDANTVTGSLAGNVLKGHGGDDTLHDQHLADVTYYAGVFAATDNDVLEGGAGNDTLHSWGGADTLAGGAGDDELYVARSGRSVTVRMATGGGIDTLTQDAGQTLDVTVELAPGIRQQDVQLVQANGITSVQLADGTRLDTQQANRVTLVFQDGVQLDGTAGPDLLVGGTSKDTLSGGAGNDTLAGGRGADLYLIAPGTGHDVVDDLFTGSGYAAEDGASDLLQFTGGLVPAGVTVLKQVTGSATTGIVLRLDATGDSVTLMQAYAAGNVGAVEAVRFDSGTQWDLATLKTLVAATVGSSGNDTLTGSAGNDVLDGAGGTDSMSGGAGNDTYHVDRAQDVIVEASGAGTDTAIASFSGYVLPANVERGQLATGTEAWGMTGNTLANALTGNAGNNRLDGGTGIDTLTGGAGNDSYVIDVAGDVVTEAQGAGWDTIESPIALTLVANVEGLRLTGTGKIAGTGNGGNNALLGNSNINTLNGAAGHDILMGEGGNDVLSDTAGNNALDGGAGNDTLAVGPGNDFLAGGTGNDTVTFGSGADVFAFNRGDGIDSFNAPTAGAGQGEANDTVSLGRVRFDELRFSRETSDLVIKINGTTDALRLKGWYSSAANQTVVNLQMVVETASDYAPASQDLLRATRVTLLDFKELVGLYDAARAINTSLVNWQPSEAQLQAAWVSGSNSLAYGGIDAYRYAKDATLANANFEAATGQLAAQVVGVAGAFALEG